jgi:hypothetical protein
MADEGMLSLGSIEQSKSFLVCLGRFELSEADSNPRSFPILNKTIPDEALQLGSRPTILVEDIVVPSYPKSPECSPRKELPKFPRFNELP